MRRRYAVRLASVTGLATAALLAGCGGQDAATPAVTAPAPTSSSTTTTATTATTARTLATTVTTSTPPRTTTSKPRPKPSTTAPAARKSPATRTAAAPKPAQPAKPANTCRVPSGVSAAQVVLVDSSGASATVRACRRTDSGYTTELGPYYGHVGRNGVSANKREGDLRTPAGVFPLRGGFGAHADPGLRIGSWLRVDARDVWVDDPGSDLYNTHQRTPANGRWDSAEKLLNQPAYNYAQVIGYNEGRTPGRGSAIFLHVDQGGGTAGCVSLPTQPLLAVLRWERAGAVIAIR